MGCLGPSNSHCWENDVASLTRWFLYLIKNIDIGIFSKLSLSIQTLGHWALWGNMKKSSMTENYIENITYVWLSYIYKYVIKFKHSHMHLYRYMLSLIITVYQSWCTYGAVCDNILIGNWRHVINTKCLIKPLWPLLQDEVVKMASETAGSLVALRVLSHCCLVPSYGDRDLGHQLLS